MAMISIKIGSVLQQNVEGDRDIDDPAGSSQIASVRMAISGLTW